MPDAIPSTHPPPQTSGESAPISRRSFLKAGAVAAGACCYAAALGYPVLRYLASASDLAAAAEAENQITLDRADKLPPGSALMFKLGGKPALLIHHADHSWSALSAVCTHFGCTVQFEPEKARIYCACHGGVFDPKTGKNLSGPPPRPLPVYRVTLTEGKVIVSRA